MPKKIKNPHSFRKCNFYEFLKFNVKILKNSYLEKLQTENFDNFFSYQTLPPLSKK